jgi:hypothetical protein
MRGGPVDRATPVKGTLMAIRGRYSAGGTVTLFDTVTGLDALAIAPDGTVNIVTAGKLEVGGTPLTIVQGIADGYKVARGVHQIAAASDTVATGLTTVVAAVVSLQDAPTGNIFAVAADIGDQAGTPVAGSILIKSYKTPSTPAPATTFSDNVHVAWVAVGT